MAIVVEEAFVIIKVIIVEAVFKAIKYVCSMDPYWSDTYWNKIQ